jgi:hypothetical protein
LLGHLVETCAPTEARAAAVDPAQQMPAPHALTPQVEHTRKQRISPFWRHFLEMFAAMAIGMVTAGAVVMTITGLKTWDQVTIQYPTQALVAMAAGMSIPMAAWMLYRGMGRKNTSEMAAAMVLPVLPFLCLVWFGVTKSAQCGGYCAVTIVAMLALMRYRRSQYSMPI